MGLESGTYIDDLVQTNPLATDNKSQGDDHLRLIKDVLKNSFPDVDNAVRTVHVGTTAPASPQNGTLWRDTTNSLWKFYDGASWITMAIDFTTSNKVDIDAGTIDGVSIGANAVITELNVDNLKLDANTLSSTNTNGDINLTPNGTGSVVIGAADINGGAIDGVSIGAASAATEASVDNLKLDGNTLSSTDLNGNIVLVPNGTGKVQADGLFLPAADGSANQPVVTDGAGNLSFGAINLTDVNITGGTVLADSANWDGDNDFVGFYDASAAANRKIEMKRIAVHTGSMFMWFGSTAPAGWLLMQGGTIGNAASGATARADADTEELFEYLWNNLADAQAPVSTGRGASAQADFDAGKTITIPDMRGRGPMGKDSGTFLTPGSTGGSETHTLTVAEMPAHDHGAARQAAGSSGVDVISQGNNAASRNFNNDVIDNTGGGSAHNNLQPWMSMNFIVKL